MTSTRSSAFTADNLGIWASVFCTVHCILTPVLISFSAVFAHFIPGEERTHRTLAIGVAALGAIALFRGFRIHGRRRILALMTVGLLCIFMGAFYGDRLPAHAYEVGITLTGSIFMISAHRLNHTFCKACTQCSHHQPRA